MIRFVRLSRKLPASCKFLHTVKSRELDEPAYYKKPLDPIIIELVKKHNSDILYSSHIELSKKILTFKQRTELQSKLGRDAFMERLEKARESEPSLVAERLAEFSESTLNKDHVHSTELVSTQQQPEITDSMQEKNEQERLQFTKSKLKILSEMGLRRSALEHELQEFPDNWMEDYETFNESDHLADTQYGTPGNYNNNNNDNK